MYPDQLASKKPAVLPAVLDLCFLNQDVQLVFKTNYCLMILQYVQPA